MQRIFYRSMAEVVFWFHVAVGFFLVFAWEFKQLYPFYLATLLVALVTNTFSDFCFLAKWECYFRQKLDPDLDFQTFFTFYFKKFFGLKLDPKTFHKAILFILWSVFFINLFYWFYIYARA